MELKNGATVIKRLGKFVMAKFNGEFVTWIVDSEGNCNWGHYFGDDSLAAVNDLQKRYQEHNEFYA